jgi:hypothetical protein
VDLDRWLVPIDIYETYGEEAVREYERLKIAELGSLAVARA